jgi:predicted O-linked N-acetylglucosamine transferase (SPINDLY family)
MLGRSLALPLEPKRNRPGCGPPGPSAIFPNLLARATKRDATMSPPTPQSILDAFRRCPSDAAALRGFLDLRRSVANALLSAPEPDLPRLLAAEVGAVHTGLIDAGARYLPADAQELAFLDQGRSILRNGLGHPQSFRAILAAMLYCRADVLPVPLDLPRVPPWLLKQYVWYVAAHPDVMDNPGDNDRWLDYLTAWMDHLLAHIDAQPRSPLVQHAAWHTLEKLGLIQAFFSTRNLRDVYARRGRIIDYVLRQLGHAVDYSCPIVKDRPRLRLGILKWHFLAQTETFHTLPLFEHLDRGRFEVILYALGSQDTPVERYCRARADRFVVLPQEMRQRIQAIRNDQLDALIVAPNVAAWTNDVVLMAAHRLARIQGTIYSSPVTTGLKTMDFFISGALSEPPDAQADYTERLCLLDGPGFAFSYIEPQPPTTRPTRQSLGIAPDAVVYASGANYFKIIPEQRDLWARILAAVPRSVLMLWPFSPAWQENYQQFPFIQRLHAAFARHGVEDSRLILIPPLPSRSDVLEHLKLADVYLDSVRHAGSHTLADALEAGVPPVVHDGPHLRSRHAAGMLRSAGLDGLIASSEPDFFNLAVHLGNDPALRDQKRQQVIARIAARPSFFDSPLYARHFASALKRLIRRPV